MKRTPLQKMCYNAYRFAIKHGLLIPHPCEICGNQEAEGHHPDHTRPLEVIWLCHSCHGLHHSLINAQNISEEQRLKISQAKLGHPVAEETRAKLRAANLGKAHTESTKSKMKESQRRRRAEEKMRNRSDVQP